MWFYPVVVVLVILAVVGATVAGGIYTIVLVPIAAIIAISAIVYAMWGRALAASSGGADDATHVSTRPLPHRRRRPSGRAPSSPDALAEARRQQQ